MFSCSGRLDDEYEMRHWYSRRWNNKLNRQASISSVIADLPTSSFIIAKRDLFTQKIHEISTQLWTSEFPPRIFYHFAYENFKRYTLYRMYRKNHIYLRRYPLRNYFDLSRRLSPRFFSKPLVLLHSYMGLMFW